MIRELDIVALTVDLPELDLREGDVGAVVLVYKDGKMFEAEFVNPAGETRALATLGASQIRRLPLDSTSAGDSARPIPSPSEPSKPPTKVIAKTVVTKPNGPYCFSNCRNEW